MLVFFSISPLGAGESVSSSVAEIIDLITKSGMDYQVTSMGTIFEGPSDQVFDLLKRCHAKMKESHHRVTSKILIDDRGDMTRRIRSKVASIEKHLGHSLER